jgi:hypothetical protein
MRALSSVAIAVACVVMPTRAEASTSAPPRVDVAVVGAAANVDEVGSRIASWFRAQQVPVQTQPVVTLEPSLVLAPTAQPGVHAWVAVLDDKLARVFFRVDAEGAQPRYLVTEIAFDNGLDEVGVERLAQVVYLSAMGLWEGNLESSRREVEEELRKQAGVQPAPVASPASSPLPPSTSGSERSPSPRDDANAWVGVRTGFEYTVRWRGDPGLGQSVGLSLGAFRHAGAFEVGGVLHAGAILPASTTASGVELDTQGVTFALGAAGSRLVRRTKLTAEVGLAADAVRYRTGSVSDPSLRPTSGGTDVQPFAFVRAGASFDVGPVGLGVEAILEISMVRTHYDVVSDNRRSELVVPWLAQPGLVAGASW